ncbi:MAG: hypothetical protein ACRDGT_09060, partial [Candidatus Limnocylindria bacterium]
DELRARGERRIELVIGMYRDKDAARIVRLLLPFARRVWCTSPSGARALPAADLERVVRHAGRAPVEVRDRIGPAIDGACAENRGMVVVTGSLALVGEARDHLGLAPAERLWD